jgi:hypothetical protein
MRARSNVKAAGGHGLGSKTRALAARIARIHAAANRREPSAEGKLWIREDPS